MPEIEIRPAALTDMNSLLQMDHSYQTAYVWQMDRFIEKGVINIHFRETRLPRPVRVDYPNPPEKLVNDFSTKGNVLAAVIGNVSVGYIQITENPSTSTAWVINMAVIEELRHKGNWVGIAVCRAKLGRSAQPSPDGVRNAVKKFPGNSACK